MHKVTNHKIMTATHLLQRGGSVILRFLRGGSFRSLPSTASQLFIKHAQGDKSQNNDRHTPSSARRQRHPALSSRRQLPQPAINSVTTLQQATTRNENRHAPSVRRQRPPLALAWPKRLRLQRACDLLRPAKRALAALQARESCGMALRGGGNDGRA